MDRLLDQARCGPFYLVQPPIAEMVVDAIFHNSEVLGHYEIHAFVVMPNHVHLLITPAMSLPKLTKSLKGITARRANEMLGLTGTRFWQEESYDHTIRNRSEFETIRRYIEQNPVRAGIVTEAHAFRWSSATRGSAPPRPVLS
jgi:REP element-mobilizing transposase RayT